MHKNQKFTQCYPFVVVEAEDNVDDDSNHSKEGNNDKEVEEENEIPIEVKKVPKKTDLKVLPPSSTGRQRFQPKKLNN